MQTVQAGPGFSILLGDLDADRFFAEHWERRSVHLAHGDPGRFAHLVTPDSFFEVEARRCVHLKASGRNAAGWNEEIPIAPEQAPKLFRAGMTICATMLDESGPIGEVVSAFRSAVATAAPPHVNAYYSPDQRGYGLHFDTHPVWILQVAGVKHWTVGREPAVHNPPFNLVFPPERMRVSLPWIELDRPDVDDPEAFLQVRLVPGDVLYLPAGCWHAASAEGSSLALTLALGRLSTVDLFTLLVGQRLRLASAAAGARLSPLPRGGGGEEAARADLRSRLAADLAELRDLVAGIDEDALLGMHGYLADHPEALADTRQLGHARDQVRRMKSGG